MLLKHVEDGDKSARDQVCIKNEAGEELASHKNMQHNKNCHLLEKNAEDIVAKVVEVFNMPKFSQGQSRTRSKSAAFLHQNKGTASPAASPSRGPRPEGKFYHYQWTDKKTGIQHTQWVPAV